MRQEASGGERDYEAEKPARAPSDLPEGSRTVSAAGGNPVTARFWLLLETGTRKLPWWADPTGRSRFAIGTRKGEADAGSGFAPAGVDKTSCTGRTENRIARL